ncbi:unnamed protein product [Tilletia caries]|uniref:Malate synthase C-terminal domain-containing protein n=1 Tax=Tilletia caries TaxID=13290 RepID=A0ABN7IR07_9BASI|nr:unnamed protein product [Tilletia caries]
MLWHWVYHGTSTNDGKPTTASLIDRILDEEATKLTKLSPKRLDLSKRYLSQQPSFISLCSFFLPPIVPTADLTTSPTSSPALLSSGSAGRDPTAARSSVPTSAPSKPSW